ncbi:glycine zipper 2TM domain-containing protein [Ferrimonas balearica]|uniref:glycine zipper 2TM domain-containing protein n=1 Tax=Ferrimonas balearica TaxID=44012 RepID=UPI001C9A15D4|nr:glycine zipper 2TM domain-containing protein [Ferrimonas balearica]MBY5920329.1 glycine zipper 2TM domain-containing protein [Ferrimonas balearica]MBY5996986.1 glycine zipper 2TM domain-containing protein [Ferrimonas balearica]
MLIKRLSLMLIGFILAANALANYNRNQAVPVEKVVYGSVESVREVSREELIEDRNRGWKVFGGALIGGVIGHQFGGGSGQDVATVLGALAGAGLANRSANQQQVRQYRLVEMMILTEGDERLMVIQDYDPGMVFRAGQEVRVVYLSGGQVRVDKAM